METCFNHPDTAKVGTCKYCGKDFCSECLYLQGQLESLMCINCFGIYKKKYSSSIKRRYIYAIAGIVVSVLFCIFAILDFSAVSVMLLFLAVVSIVLNIVRISQMKKAMIVKPYTSAEFNSVD